MTGLNLSNNTVDWTGTTVFQAETTGSASVSGLVATNVGVAGTYNYGYPNDTAGTFTFDPSTGNTVTITFSAVSERYLRLTFTANTGWPAGQLSELQAYAS